MSVGLVDKEACVMSKQYAYFVDNVEVSRKDFFAKLRKCCHKAVRIDTIAGWCGVDIMEFDEKQYREAQRDIRNGSTLIMFRNHKGTSFKRKRV
jgi:hypothetical protein